MQKFLLTGLIAVAAIASGHSQSLAADNIPLGLLREPFKYQRAGEAATYTILSVKAGEQSTVETINTRVSSQSTSYTQRAYQCETGKTRTLASADTYEGLATSKPDPNWSNLVPGSSAYLTGQKACSVAGRNFGG